MKLSQFFRKNFAANGFTELELTTGEKIRVAGELTIGATVHRVDAEGLNAGPLPDGTYTTTSGYRIQVKEGKIADLVALEQPPAPAPEAYNRPAGRNPAGHTAPVPELPAQADESQAGEDPALQTRVAQLEQQLRSYSRAQRELPPAVSPAPAVNTRYSHSGTPDREAIAEGIRMIRYARAGHPEYRFNPANARRFATGTGVNFNDLLARCPDIAAELFHSTVLEEGLAQYFNVLDVNVQGDATLDVELPNLDDTEPGSYLQSGIGCTYTPSGQTVLSKRSMQVRPWHYYREYCPKEWGNSFRGLAYVNDEELPYESVILEYLFSKIRNTWEQTLMTGDTGTTGAFDGLLTQIEADTDIPSGNVVTLVPTGTNAVAEFEKLLAAVPPHLFARFQSAPMAWFTPNAHLEFYVQNYRATYAALPYNNRFEKFGPDSALKRAQFLPTAYLTDHHILTPRENLYLGVGKDMEVDVQFHDAGKDQYLFVRVEGHTGVGYPRSEDILLGDPTP